MVFWEHLIDWIQFSESITWQTEKCHQVEGKASLHLATDTSAVPCHIHFHFTYKKKKKKDHPWLKDLCGFYLLNLINTFMKGVVIYFRSWEKTHPCAAVYSVWSNYWPVQCFIYFSSIYFSCTLRVKRAGGGIGNISSSYKIKPALFTAVKALLNFAVLCKGWVIRALFQQ